MKTAFLSQGNYNPTRSLAEASLLQRSIFRRIGMLAHASAVLQKIDKVLADSVCCRQPEFWAMRENASLAAAWTGLSVDPLAGLSTGMVDEPCSYVRVIAPSLLGARANA